MKIENPSAEEDHFCDLHGLTVAEVTARIQEELQRAFTTKTKRIIFIHGIGRHSDAGESNLAKRAREFLKALSATPYSVIRRLEFGEQSKELNGNAGCVRVTLALQLSRDQVAFTPSAKSEHRAKPRNKIAARRAGTTANPDEDKIVKKVEDALNRRFGKPGLEKSYRPADIKKGEWPGQR